MTSRTQIRLLAAAFLAVVAWPASAAPTFSSLVIFADSLGDTGNNAYVFDNVPGPWPVGARTATPIPNDSFVPTFPYASDRYSNGPVWVEGLAAGLGLSAQASLLGGTNFAFGGARSGPAGSSFPFSLLDQVSLFLGGVPGGMAPSSALYVVEGGGNDARDTFEEAASIALGGGDPTALIAGAAFAFASNIGSIISELELAGARDILLATVPDIGLTPAVRSFGLGGMALGSAIASAMNDALYAMLAGLTPSMTDGIRILDLYGLVDDVVAHPGDYGLTDVIDACAASQACIDNPDTTFFWDGIHPTTVGHAILARAALRTIPEPGTVLLIAIAAFALLSFELRRRVGTNLREKAA